MTGRHGKDDDNWLTETKTSIVYGDGVLYFIQLLLQLGYRFSISFQYTLYGERMRKGKVKWWLPCLAKSNENEKWESKKKLSIE